MAWVLVVFLLLIVGALVFLLIRATRRLFEYDELLKFIVGPMQDYAHTLRKIATTEGLLLDNPEVLEFHRANLELLAKIDSAITSIHEARPPEQEPKGLPPQVV